MKKITIIALHLGYGGIEKAIASLSNMLCDEYEINIISTYKLYEKPPFFINNKVKIEYLINDKPNKKEFIFYLKRKKFLSVIKEGLKSIKLLYLKRYKMIKAIKKIDTDIIISTRSFHNLLVGKYANKKTKKIAWEHSHHNGNKKYITDLKKSCQNMDYLISVSIELNGFYNTIMKNAECRYISLALDEFPNKLSTLDKKEIAIIGRLSKEKGFIDLIDVFKLVAEKNPDWHLNIVGDGLEKEAIEKRIIEKELSKNITMHGFQDKQAIDKILLNTSIYVMTSYTESFGLVLIEAMSYGIPCLAFDSAQGSREIIDNEQNGFIIKDRNIQVMANKINLLIEDNKLRKNMGESARKKSKIYSTEKVKKDWKELL